MPETAKQLRNLWVIEDDRIYRDVLCGGLNASLKGIEIREFETEHEALQQMEKVEAGDTPPDLIIADVMLPYVFPGKGEVPAEIAALGDDSFRAAGVRLWKKARSSTSPRLRSVPWIYHSVLRQKGISFEENSDADTYYVGKDQTFDDLIEVERAIFEGIDLWWDEGAEIESKRLAESTTMKARLLSAMEVPPEDCVTTLE